MLSMTRTTEVATGTLLLAFVLAAVPHTADARRAVERGQTDPKGLMVRGQARVVDGDTLDVAGRRVRLEGIDAPEMRQTCPSPRHANRTWPAGRVAARELERLVRGRAVTCRQIGRDDYGRVLGRCQAGGTDLNAALIRRGLAWAFVKYSKTFVTDERAARKARLGVWSSTCMPAWEYRTGRWRDGDSKAPAGCPIKGNISRKGRIYHLPWSPWYQRTRIDTAKGERWFCDEGQAIAAGWRPARPN